MTQKKQTTNTLIDSQKSLTTPIKSTMTFKQVVENRNLFDAKGSVGLMKNIIKKYI